MDSNIRFATPQPTTGPPQKMRVISLWQPWASLVVTGKKTYETRPRNTNIRGTVLIHATQSIPADVRAMLESKRPLTGAPSLVKSMVEANLSLDTLPLGAIIGQVDIVRTLTTNAWDKEKEADKANHNRWAREFWLGNYDAGRWAWELANPVLFKQPIPAKGWQGFWFFDMAPYQHVLAA